MITVNVYGSETKIINDSYRSLDSHNITLYNEWPCDGGRIFKKNMKLTCLSPLLVLYRHRWLKNKKYDVMPVSPDNTL